MNDREAFEKWISGPPYELSIARYPNDPTRYGFPSTYREHDVDLCWLAWQEAIAQQQDELERLVELEGKLSSIRRHAVAAASILAEQTRQKGETA